MKNILIMLCIFLCGGTSAFAQKCGIEATKKALIAKDPSWADRFAAQVASLQGIADNYKQQTSSGAAERTTTISPVPVIFHIIVTDSQLNLMGGTTGILNRINSQIAVLNADYNKANTDGSLIPAGWLSYYGNVGVHFGLAHTQPNGYGTPGYELSIIPSSPGGFSEGGNSYGSAKHSGTGGLDAWDNTKYLNVWCINFADNSGLLGLTVPLSFTGGSGYPVSEAGVCINFLALGKRSSPSDNYIPAYSPGDYYDLGRTLTHEIGHVFEIWHPWGDDGGQCSTWSSDTTVNGITCESGVGQDDGLADTPPESNAIFGNPAYTVPGGTENDCCMMNGSVNTQPIGIACLSFLDYTDDIGMHLFTTQQAAAMAQMVLSPPATGIGATGSGYIGESYSLTQNPALLNWPAGTMVQQTALNNSLTISPNPTIGIVNIAFNSQTDVLNGITVTNMLGQEVQNINTAGSQNDYYSIDLSGMSKGIYIVRCNFASGTITRKILLQ